MLLKIEVPRLCRTLFSLCLSPIIRRMGLIDENFVETEQSEIFESFVCCVCLDLLYKPIVLSCGHVSCFWCVHKSMDGVRESHCPVCRHPYYHFPTICQMLHFLLLKMYPVAYTGRENQMLEEEKKMECFSPQIDINACGLQAKFDHPGTSPSSTTNDPVSNSCNLESSECMEQSGSATHEGKEGAILSVHTSDRTPEVIETPSVEGRKSPQNNEHSQQQKILFADVMCTKCKQMLFHPVVLNCGHVYCEVCIINSADEMLRCHVCQSPHPRGFPKVCLALDHFLEEQFPEEYAQRKEAVLLSQVKVKPETSSSCSMDAGKGERMNWLSDLGLKVHRGAGCDFCGMYPIIGDRYRCVDCKERIGFDLCGDCYKTRSKLPGRFNQQHTPEHKFELVSPVTPRLGYIGYIEDPIENLELISEDPGLADDEEDNQNESEAAN